MKKLIARSLLLFVPALVFGQVTILPYPPPKPVAVYEELSKFLNLTDAQVEALLSVEKSRNEAAQAIYIRMNEKQMALDSLLRNETTDATQVGQLMLDIRNLQKQVPLDAGPYKAQALGTLTEEQKKKLPTLSQALELQTPAWQAINLSLIDSPTPVYRGIADDKGLIGNTAVFSPGAEAASPVIRIGPTSLVRGAVR